MKIKTIKNKQIKTNYKMIYEENWRYVSDDWYPNYSNDKIKILLVYNSNIIDENKEDKIKIVAQGADDYGLEIVLYGNKLLIDKCREFIKNIPEIIDKKYFEDRLFIHI